MRWTSRLDGVEHSSFGMYQTPRQMLNLGQLMKQGGDDLVDAAWIRDTFNEYHGNTGQRATGIAGGCRMRAVPAGHGAGLPKVQMDKW